MEFDVKEQSCEKLCNWGKMSNRFEILWFLWWIFEKFSRSNLLSSRESADCESASVANNTKSVWLPSSCVFKGTELRKGRGRPWRHGNVLWVCERRDQLLSLYVVTTSGLRRLFVTSELLDDEAGQVKDLSGFSTSGPQTSLGLSSLVFVFF